MTNCLIYFVISTQSVGMGAYMKESKEDFQSEQNLIFWTLKNIWDQKKNQFFEDNIETFKWGVR